MEIKLKYEHMKNLCIFPLFIQPPHPPSPSSVSHVSDSRLFAH